MASFPCLPLLLCLLVCVRISISETPTQLKNHQYIDGDINVSALCCLDRAEEVYTMVKSASMATHDLSRLHFHLIADEHCTPPLHDLMQLFGRNTGVRYTFYPAEMPEDAPNFVTFRMLWPGAVCTGQKLLLTELLPPSVGLVMQIDSDVVIFKDLQNMWSNFRSFNETNSIMMVTEHENLNIGWYNRFARHPYPSTTGVNAGLLFLNLTRMREDDFLNSALAYQQQYSHAITWGDQCVFNIYLALHPEKMREAPCVLNYRTEHCRYGENCKLAQEAGIGLLHGSRGVFHKAYGDNQAFMSFALVYDTFFHHPFGQESILLSDVESNANEDGDGPHDRTDGGDCSRAGEARGECVDASKERHRLDPERKGHHTRQMKQVLLSLMKEMRDSPPLHQPRYARCAALPLLPAWKVGKWEEELGEEAYAYDLWKAIDDGEAEIEMREGHDDDCDIHDDKHHDHASNDYRNENEYENGNDDIDNSNHENENRNRNENGNDDDNGTDDVDSDGKRDNLVDTQTSNNPITLVERLAYATLLTSTSYLPGVLTLIQSLRTHSTLTQAGACDVVVMMNEVPGKEIEELLLYPSLNTQGNIKVVRVKNIDHPMSVNNNIESGDGHGKTRSGPSISSFADTYTKLRMWELTQYDTIVYLDADTLIMQNPDTLFKQRHAQERRQNERSGTDNSVDRADDNHRNDDFNHKLGNDRKTIRDKANDTSSQPAASCERYGVSAAPDCCPPLVFNSGVMVLVPCRSTFSKMMRGLHTMQQVALQGDTAIEHSKYKLALLFGENEFLHMFFPQYRQLHYGFNMGQYTYAVQRRMEHYTKHSVNMVKIYHFTGRKPWLYVPSGALTEAERDEKTSFPGWKQPYYKLWWSVFLNFFHSSSSACAKVGSSECHSRLDRVISKYTSSSHQVKGFFTRNQHLTDLPFYRLGANVLTRGVDSS